MVLWLIMFISVLLIPVLMILFGWKFRSGGPAKINHFYGYRTGRSMINRQTWDFAHRCLGRYWWKLGRWTLFPAMLIMILLLGRKENTVAMVSSALCVILCIPLTIPMILTEQKLKKTFDMHGKRMKPIDLTDLDQM